MGPRSGLHLFLLATKGWTWSKSIIVIRINIVPYIPVIEISNLCWNIIEQEVIKFSTLSSFHLYSFFRENFQIQVAVFKNSILEVYVLQLC